MESVTTRGPSSSPDQSGLLHSFGLGRERGGYRLHLRFHRLVHGHRDVFRGNAGLVSHGLANRLGNLRLRQAGRLHGERVGYRLRHLRLRYALLRRLVGERRSYRIRHVGLRYAGASLERIRYRLTQRPTE